MCLVFMCFVILVILSKCAFLSDFGVLRVSFYYFPNCQFYFLLIVKRKQEERVQQVRKKLEEALMADILSRAADTEEVDIDMDSGDDA